MFCPFSARLIVLWYLIDELNAQKIGEIIRNKMLGRPMITRWKAELVYRKPAVTLAKNHVSTYFDGHHQNSLYDSRNHNKKRKLWRKNKTNGFRVGRRRKTGTFFHKFRHIFPFPLSLSPLSIAIVLLLLRLNTTVFTLNEITII